MIRTSSLNPQIIQENELKVENKLKSLPNGAALQILAEFIKVRPIGSRNKDLLKRDLETFQSLTAKLSDK